MCDQTCLIARLIVHPDFQNQGIGTRLMLAIEAAFAHAIRYELFTGHKSSALHLYSKLGYLPFKTVPVHENLSLVYLEKQIQLKSIDT
jgi:GNAT superfamily N-acetyltransferase